MLSDKKKHEEFVFKVKDSEVRPHETTHDHLEIMLDKHNKAPLSIENVMTDKYKGVLRLQNRNGRKNQCHSVQYTSALTGRRDKH